MSDSRLEDLLDLAHVPRWSRVPLLRPQSVAEHSFRVGAIALEICRRLNHFGNNALGYANVVLEHRVLLWALVHDGPESETGDIPYPTKKFIRDRTVAGPANGIGTGIRIDLFGLQEKVACPWYEQMSHEIHQNELAIIKIADKIEEILFLNEWGMMSSPRTVSALAMATNLTVERCLEARSRYGWTNPDILQVAAELVHPYQLCSGLTGCDPLRQPKPEQDSTVSDWVKELQSKVMGPGEPGSGPAPGLPQT